MESAAAPRNGCSAQRDGGSASLPPTSEGEVNPDKSSDRPARGRNGHRRAMRSLRHDIIGGKHGPHHGLLERESNAPTPILHRSYPAVFCHPSGYVPTLLCMEEKKTPIDRSPFFFFNLFSVIQPWVNMTIHPKATGVVAFTDENPQHTNARRSRSARGTPLGAEKTDCLTGERSKGMVSFFSCSRVTIKEDAELALHDTIPKPAFF